jgi:hypothetical protein
MASKVSLITRRAAIISGGIGALSVLAAIFLDDRLASELTQPNAESGRVIPWNEKGKTYYVTKGENIASKGAITLAVVAAILPIYVFIRTRKPFTWND